MFRPIAAVIMFSSEIMVVVFYRIGMVWYTNPIKHYHHTFG